MKLSISQSYDLVDERPVAWGDGQTLWIAPLSNPEYQAHMDAYARWEAAQKRGMRAAVLNGDLDEQKTARMKEGLAKFIIRRWENVRDLETDKEVGYTWEQGLELMNDNPHFMIDIISEAANTEAFRRDRVEATGKNLSPPSVTGTQSEGTKKRPATSSSAN